MQSDIYCFKIWWLVSSPSELKTKHMGLWPSVRARWLMLPSSLFAGLWKKCSWAYLYKELFLHFGHMQIGVRAKQQWSGRWWSMQGNTFPQILQFHPFLHLFFCALFNLYASRMGKLFEQECLLCRLDWYLITVQNLVHLAHSLSCHMIVFVIARSNLSFGSLPFVLIVSFLTSRNLKH